LKYEKEYEKENKTKACFDDIYTSSTPHAYIQMMARHGYEIGEQARPYCVAAAELLNEYNEDTCPVQMLDIGCSYGMGSAFVKYGCSFDEMVGFFSTRAPRDFQAACEAMRAWLNVTPAPNNVRCVGLDSSEPAIRFAKMAGLLDYGIARNFENPDVTPNAEECPWLRNCNLLISTGSIGYVTDRTMNQVLRHAGKNHPNEFGPLAVLTILRMFESTSIRDSFENHGFRFEKVPAIMLSQRSFTDENERKGVLKILHDKNIDTSEWEDRGKMFAELFVAAKTEHFPGLLERMNETHSICVGDESNKTTYICR
jgi:carnitine O-acetyltransferase